MPDESPLEAGPPPPPADPPLVAYRTALRRYDGTRLGEIHARTGGADLGGKAARLPDSIADRLAELRAVDRIVTPLPSGSRVALGLMALAECTTWPAAGIALSLRCLGVDPIPALRGLAEVGLVALRVGDGFDLVGDFESPLRERIGQTTLLVHPAALNAARTILPEHRRRIDPEPILDELTSESAEEAAPEADSLSDHPATEASAKPPADRFEAPADHEPAGLQEGEASSEADGLVEPPPPPEPIYEPLLADAGTVRQVREADGLEPVLRLAAAWQRIDEGAIRQTQQGTYFKRDRERLEEDLVLAGPIADALEPLPDMPLLWLALARGVGLVVAEEQSDRLVAADPEYWLDNAVHLPQMIATRWLALRDWHEQRGLRQGEADLELAAPYLRAPALLWLATREDDAWVALDDLAALWDGLAPGWDRLLLGDDSGSRPQPGAEPDAVGADLLAALLLGPAYQMGLVRSGEDVPDRRRVVQLTPLGRYALALGAPPPRREVFEQFLLIQPNFEMIAYRQGLTPALIGQFSRFARWTQVGAALELKLTPDSVYRGLEGGLTTQAMLDRLTRHSPRALPAGVAEALRTWADRRDRITYHAGATLVEFATEADLEAALKLWPAPNAGRPGPTRIAARLLLVEDESTIPFTKFRMAGARDYRRPPEVCVDVEGDGVTLVLDLARSDLLVDAEIARFADEVAAPRRGADADPTPVPRRWFRISPRSLARAASSGLTVAQMNRWFEGRTGAGLPAAVRLLLHAADPQAPPLVATRPVVLATPTADLLDGLLQHPSTGPLLGDRLGPTAVVVHDDALSDLNAALATLGLQLDDPATAPAAPARHRAEPPPPSPEPTPPAKPRRKGRSS